jgi:ketosteroid isomerase-like protein
MKKLLFICVCLLIATFSYAATEEQVIESRVNQLTKAMIDADSKALSELTAEKLSYGHSGGSIEDKTAFIEKITSGHSDFVTIKLENQKVTISGDVALVRHDLKADIFDGGKAASIHLGVLLVWQKQAGEWKLLARQAIKYLPAQK